MPETRSALIVANWKYEDADLRQLLAPANDAEALAGVLRDPQICGFEVTTLLNRPSREACEEIERFFLNRRRDDLLLLYFSCHGIKDDDGQLFFAAPDTRMIDHSRPMRSTALGADFVRSVMRASNSRRQVLILDCCYSGAFAGAMMGKGDKSVGVREHFEQGRGMVVMTASDALQYSFEGDKVEGEAVRSIFTRTLVKGIETGEADRDRDGTISLDELYDYVYEQVVEQNANQRPRKWTLEVEGKIIVAHSPVVKAAELAPDLLSAINSPLARIRLGAVGELGDLLRGSHKGLGLAAREALEKLAGDDSRQVSAEALLLLGQGAAETPPSLVPAAPIKPAPAPVIPPQDLKPRPAPRPEPGEQPPKPAQPAGQGAPVPIEPNPPRESAATGRPGSERRILGFAVPNLGAIAMVTIMMVGIIAYNWLHRAAQPGQSSSETKVAETGGKSAGPLTPIALPRPPFDYTLAEARGADAKIKLVEQSEKPNQITDEEVWFGSNDLSMPTFTVPNSFKQEAGNIPAEIPVKQGDDLLIKAIKQDHYILCFYGANYGSGRYLTIFDLNTGKPTFAFDFHEFILPPKYSNADREFIDEVIKWAVLKDDVLYVSNGHSTYAKSSYGQNAYVTAIDAKTGRMLWRSAPLVSNSEDFILFQGAIITGYGFTAEPHYLYVLNEKDGRVLQNIKLKKTAEYILRKGDDIFVRTYDTDYVFKGVSQSE